MPIFLTTDSLDLVSHLSHLNATVQEKRLMGDFEDLAEALRSGELEAVFWLPHWSLMSGMRVGRCLFMFHGMCLASTSVRYV